MLPGERTAATSRTDGLSRLERLMVTHRRYIILERKRERRECGMGGAGSDVRAQATASPQVEMEGKREGRGFDKAEGGTDGEAFLFNAPSLAQ